MNSEHTTGDHCPDCFNAGYDARDQRAESRTATTEKVKHTGGPWCSEPVRAFDFSVKEFCTRIYADDPGPERDFTIAIVREADPELRAVHARLIAASPEMLSALEQLAECNLNEDNCASFEVANRRIRNIVLPAIRRAKGE